MAKQQFPQQELDNLPQEFVSEVVTSLRQLSDKGKPHTLSELKSRIDDYFSYCGRSGMRPGVESLALSLGITRKTLYMWEVGQGCDNEWQEVICKAKGFLAAFWEQSMTRGRINPASGIFIAKNWFAYKDTVSFESDVSAASDNQPVESVEQIMRKHATAALQIPEEPPEG